MPVLPVPLQASKHPIVMGVATARDMTRGMPHTARGHTNWTPPQPPLTEIDTLLQHVQARLACSGC